MDLKGAEIRNILEMCMSIGTKTQVPLKVNIPYYQRPYRWDEKRIQNLIDDFYKNKNENANAEYFVGSVVLVEDPEIENKYDIIDGQQRVTTVFLLNYLRFVIQRSYIEELISIKRGNLDGPLQELERFYGDLFGRAHLGQLTQMRIKIIEKMEPIFSLSESEREQVFHDISTLYRQTVYLPERDFSNLEDYYKKYEQLQQQFIGVDTLALTYDRSTFNETLLKALSKVCVIVSKDDNPKLKVLGNEQDPDILQYTNAVQYEFNALVSHMDYSGRPIQNTQELLRFITEVIENIRFCVIMTGNERDAYTLFEVLNDRAMEIDDLELIKNLFLKAYCTSSGDPDPIIDKNIGTLDQIWGDEVFTRDLTTAHSKLISYLATLYFTADEKAFTNKLERYREIIDDKYLSGYNTSSNKYSYVNAINDIRVYQMLRMIIEEYRLPVRNAASSSIKAEDNPQVSITYRTFHLLNALKLDGVMPALTNIIIRQYMNKMHDQGIDKVSIPDFKNYICAIRDDNQHNANSNEFRTIHDLAFKLWKAALLCKDYELPREIAKKALQNISMKTWNPSGITIDVETHSKMINQFKEWTQNWQYGKSAAADLKIKILFINLFKTKFNEGSTDLVFDKTVYSFVTDKLQLDHMEAHNPDASNMAKHFSPADPHELRQKYIDSLGNFMILDNENNNDKNNKPLAEAMYYYDNMCADHWLIKEAKSLLRAYHKSVNIDGVEFSVPTEKFFNERASRLRTYFERIVVRDLDAKKVTVWH